LWPAGEAWCAGARGNELGFGMWLLIYFVNVITVVESVMGDWK
jgi:hypothetical protein